MCDTKGSGSEPGASSKGEGRVISLCEHRRRRAIEENIEALIAHLEEIHRRAIEVHNGIIERAQLSVLTELCRTTGLFLDLIDESLQAAVVTPAALYGNSGGDIFGKKPLQERIRRAVDDPEASDLLERLNAVHPGVWEVQRRDGEPVDVAIPLAGPERGQGREIGGVVVRAGQVSDTPGVYSGWPVSFRGEEFIVFGHLLNRRREVSVRNLLTARDDRDDAEVWSRVELSLLRAILDPDDRHQPSLPGEQGYEAIRHPVSRSGLLLAIHRTLWRHFSEPCQGLTIHAHIAALADDADSRRAFVDEVCEIIETVTLRSGGLEEGEEPVEVGEVLAPFYTDHRGRLVVREELCVHPMAMLLLDDEIYDITGLDREDPISAALVWADDHPDRSMARRIELAWMNVRIEQNLTATYGWCAGDDFGDAQQEEGGLSFVRRSAVLPNIRTLFDARFMSHTLADLDLDAADRSRLQRGLDETGKDLDTYTLSDIDRDERMLNRLRGVSHQTCSAVRSAILDLATHWRWRRCGLDPSRIRWTRDSTPDPRPGSPPGV